MIDMKLTRQYFDVKDVRFGDTCFFAAGILTVSEKELQALTADLFKAVGGFHLEITHPGENARIIHVLDTIAPHGQGGGGGHTIFRLFQHALYRGPGRYQHALRLCGHGKRRPALG